MLGVRIYPLVEFPDFNEDHAHFFQYLIIIPELLVLRRELQRLLSLIQHALHMVVDLLEGTRTWVRKEIVQSLSTNVVSSLPCFAKFFLLISLPHNPHYLFNLSATRLLLISTRRCSGCFLRMCLSNWEAARSRVQYLHCFFIVGRKYELASKPKFE